MWWCFFSFIAYKIYLLKKKSSDIVGKNRSMTSKDDAFPSTFTFAVLSYCLDSEVAKYFSELLFVVWRSLFRGDLITSLLKTAQVVSTLQVEKNQWQSLRGDGLGSLQGQRAAWPPLRGATALGMCCRDTLWVIFPFLIKCVCFGNKT